MARILMENSNPIDAEIKLFMEYGYYLSYKNDNIRDYVKVKYESPDGRFPKQIELTNDEIRIDYSKMLQIDTDKGLIGLGIGNYEPQFLVIVSDIAKKFLKNL